ncbi:hypothetical protein KIMH_11880 [Bombiscardovia apis]|uniref:DivIVA domain-containing protein n=1 Tax=Bombiscardovia apis TaxID=2932182 RepID=A0ABN6SGE2_9BIFI|nr:hypothetical protein [Bombiscardovia apis]BDR55077.1 hypothetical protein KIMH_11880 [Bombiscardovia apis]
MFGRKKKTQDGYQSVLGQSRDRDQVPFDAASESVSSSDGRTPQDGQSPNEQVSANNLAMNQVTAQDYNPTKLGSELNKSEIDALAQFSDSDLSRFSAQELAEVTPEWVGKQLFRQVRFIDGYKVEDVDDAIDKLQGMLEAVEAGSMRPAFVVQTIMGMEFEFVRYKAGYDISEVDNFLNQVSASLLARM